MAVEIQHPSARLAGTSLKSRQSYAASLRRFATVRKARNLNRALQHSGRIRNNGGCLVSKPELTGVRYLRSCLALAAAAARSRNGWAPL